MFLSWLHADTLHSHIFIRQRGRLRGSESLPLFTTLETTILPALTFHETLSAAFGSSRRKLKFTSSAWLSILIRLSSTSSKHGQRKRAIPAQRTLAVKAWRWMPYHRSN